MHLADLGRRHCLVRTRLQSGAENGSERNALCLLALTGNLLHLNREGHLLDLAEGNGRLSLTHKLPESILTPTV